MRNAQPTTSPPSCSTSLHSARRRAAGREQVVVHEHARARADGVGVQLERVGAVLQRVVGADRVVRQVAGLAREHEARAELAGDRRPEQEAARLRPDDDVGLQVAGDVDERVDRGAQARRGSRAAA